MIQPPVPVDVDVKLPRRVGPGEVGELGKVQDGIVLVDVPGVGIPGEVDLGGVDGGRGGLQDGGGHLEEVLPEVVDGGAAGDLGAAEQGPRLPQAVMRVVRIPAARLAVLPFCCYEG